MFSHCLQSLNSIELYNSNKKELVSNWKFTGKHTKIYDNTLKNYMHILDQGSLSKMEIPPSSKQSLGIFQSYIVFQLYLFTTKQFSIEIAISDTTKTKRRLIFSTNNRDITINQLHCRIPILQFPIGTWVNYSIDILSFISEFFKDLTFRSVEYICLSASGKVREIFSMRNQLKNIIDDDSYGESIPVKLNLPLTATYDNINMNVNRVITQMTIENKMNSISMKVMPTSMIKKERFGYQNQNQSNILTHNNSNNNNTINDTNVNEDNLNLIHPNIQNDIQELRNHQEFIDVGYQAFNKEEYNRKYQQEKIGLMPLSKEGSKKGMSGTKVIGSNKHNKQSNKANEQMGLKNYDNDQLYINSNISNSNQIEDLYEAGHSDNLNIMNQISTIKNENQDERDDIDIHFKDYSPQLSDNQETNKKKIVEEILEDSSHFIINKDNINRPFSPPINQNI